MVERPLDPLRKIESMVEIIGIAHTTIFTQHRLLVDRGRDNDRTRGMLDESVRIVFTEAASVTREVRLSAERWAEEQLLDPPRARATWPLLAAEVEEVEHRLGDLLARQEEIAAELQERIARPDA